MSLMNGHTAGLWHRAIARNSDPSFFATMLPRSRLHKREPFSPEETRSPDDVTPFNRQHLIPLSTRILVLLFLQR